MAQLAGSSAMNAEHRAEVQRVVVVDAARRRWLTTHEGSEACAFYEALGYAKLGVMPAYSRRPDGTLSPGAFYYKELR